MLDRRGRIARRSRSTRLRQQARLMSSALPPPNSMLRASAATQRSVADLASERAAPATRPVSLGWLPALSVVAAAGLIAMAVADRLAQTTAGAGQPLFWFS